MNKPLERFGYILGIILGIILIFAALAAAGALIYALWRFALTIPSTLNTLNSEVAAAIIVTAGTVFAGVVAHIAERMISKKRDIEEAHRDKKVELYRSFFEKVIVFIQTPAKNPETENSEKLANLVPYLQQFIRESILWCSPRVIKAYRKMSLSLKRDTIQAMMDMDALLREIRLDLGHSNKGLAKGDLLKMFLKDPEELDKVIKERKGN